MALKRHRDRMMPYGYYLACRRELDRLLAETYTDPDNARLAKRLRKQRPHLLRFRDHDGLDETDNVAERELRPAVIARKPAAGSRIEAGAETHTVPAGLLQTRRRQGHDILQMLGELLRHGPGHIYRSAQRGATQSDPVNTYADVDRLDVRVLEEASQSFRSLDPRRRQRGIAIGGVYGDITVPHEINRLLSQGGRCPGVQRETEDGNFPADLHVATLPF